ncbi:MAG: type II toxin-antitoxin system Phd/YefM family antitoxin [Burkholderiales bacterium]|nr:type II toxin-antitoxin system Phd/YefM family antitoxin [Burkholderiales bacterium]
MQTWPIQDAKARFSEFLDTCMRDGPQMVTKRGLDTAVLVPLPLWQRMQVTTRLSFKELLLSEEGRSDDFCVPARGNAKRRPGSGIS